MIRFLKSRWYLILSFLIPFVIMTCYFWYRNMAPFGDQSILTVDMGQQYVDFFAYFKHAVTSNPSSFFYSFSKALGGEMVGLWAYYLMSPVNLVLLLFPLKQLASGILLVTVLKYGLAGLSFAYLLYRKSNTQVHLIPAWATMYALNGWIIANQLNLIWLDGMIWLPLIVLGIERIVDTHRIRTYLISLTAMLIINYYMAYMICIFAVLYFAYYAVVNWQGLKATSQNIGRFAGTSLLAGGLSAFFLLPTYSALLTSKAEYTVTNVKWQFEYNPINLIGKFFNGAFNFDQMPNGTPNVFIGSVAIITFVAFFFLRTIKPSQKIAAGLVTAFLLLSMCLKPLDLFWHAMQFPIWYPYRFSFIFCFWVILLGNRAFNQIHELKQWAKMIIIAIIAAGIIYITLNLKQFNNFLTTENIVIGTVLMIAAIVLVFFGQPSKAFSAAMIVLVIGEMGYNVFSSLNNISYVTNPNYVNYTTNLKRPVDQIKASDDSFYRIGKTFYRTKDDPFEANYNGGDHFSSTFEKTMPQFMENIGQPDGDGFTEYSNGTLLSDSFLSMKYFLNASNPDSNQYLQALTTKPDLNQYNLMRTQHNVQTYRNQYALPIAFASSNQIFNQNRAVDPTTYQSTIFNNLIGRTYQHRMFTPINFDSSTFVNVPRQSNLTGAFLQKKNLLKPAHMMLTFTPQTNDSYYLTLGNAINLGSSQNSQNVKIYRNGVPLNQYPTYRNTVIVNVASKDKGKPITINVELTKSSVLLQNFTLYQFHNQDFETQVKKLQQNPLKITHFNSREFIGTINIHQKHQALATTIPYAKGWHLLVNGKPHPIKEWSKMFVGADLKPGHYSIKLYYWPPLLTPGIIISLSSIIITIVGWQWLKKRKSR
ncbi:YfhO family protein [Nicoliella lavandulae]|uniref:YfhO family protein n=1 Tax=Nicoliella lavandulae TaxID=3082954 RepID=A0ABU8SKU7_9LACO